ncbi:MAG TPA: hypothetical protein DCL63_11580 [Firmicutes bacterium]|nr:hypothetical protein [Bacillota bacterium]
MGRRLREVLFRAEWCGFLGFLGLLGFTKSYSGEPQYVFFSFFSFFSWFFVGYMQRETPDERLVQSHQRADSSTLKFFSLLLAALFAFVILNDNALHIRHVSMKAVELIVACVFAFSVLLRSFLVYYYDRVE